MQICRIEGEWNSQGNSPRRTQDEHGRFLCNEKKLNLRIKEKKKDNDLSHLSLLLRHGSQLIAFRARFVGGRPSLE